MADNPKAAAGGHDVPTIPSLVAAGMPSAPDWSHLAGHPWIDKDKGWVGPEKASKREFFLAYADASFKDEDWMMAFVLLNDIFKFPFADEASAPGAGGGGRPSGSTGLPQGKIAEIRSAVLGV